MSAAGSEPRQPGRRRAGAPRRAIVRSAAEVPQALLIEVMERMAERMIGTPEARSSAGLSLSFALTDVEIDPARYVVERDGLMRLHFDHEHADFRFHAPATVFDSLLQGTMHPVSAGMHGLRVTANPLRVRSLLRMLPAVQRAYRAERAALLEQHSNRYDFRF